MYDKLKNMLEIQKEFMKIQNTLAEQRLSLAKVLVKTLKEEFEQKFPALKLWNGHNDDYHLLSGLHSHEYEPKVHIHIFNVINDIDERSYDKSMKDYQINEENKFYYNSDPFFTTDRNGLSESKLMKLIESAKDVFKDSIGGVTAKEISDFVDEFNKKYFNGMDIISIFKTGPDFYRNVIEDGSSEG
jgi:hypothetical protein